MSEDEALKVQHARDLSLIVRETDRLSKSVTQLLSFASKQPPATAPVQHRRVAAQRRSALSRRRRGTQPQSSIPRRGQRSTRRCAGGRTSRCAGESSTKCAAGNSRRWTSDGGIFSRRRRDRVCGYRQRSGHRPADAPKDLGTILYYATARHRSRPRDCAQTYGRRGRLSPARAIAQQQRSEI